MKSNLSRLDKHLPGRHAQDNHGSKDETMDKFRKLVSGTGQQERRDLVPVTPASGKDSRPYADLGRQRANIAAAVAAPLLAVGGIAAAAKLVKDNKVVEKIKEAAAKNKDRQTERFISIIQSPEYKKAIQSGAVRQDDALVVARELGKTYSSDDMRAKADTMLTGFKRMSADIDTLSAVTNVGFTLAAGAAGFLVHRKLDNISQARMRMGTSASDEAVRAANASSSGRNSRTINKEDLKRDAGRSGEIEARKLLDESVTRDLGMAAVVAVALGTAGKRLSDIKRSVDTKAKMSEYFKMEKDARQYYERKMASVGADPQLYTEVTKSFSTGRFVVPGTASPIDVEELMENYCAMMSIAVLGKVLASPADVEKYLADNDRQEEIETYRLFVDHNQSLYASSSSPYDTTSAQATSQLISYINTAPEDNVAFTNFVKTPRQERSRLVARAGTNILNHAYDDASRALDSVNPLDRYMYSYLLDPDVVSLPFFWKIPEFAARVSQLGNTPIYLPVPRSTIDFQLQQWVEKQKER